jgi:enamine deaminase RidA (YjgF/YER057c/UK114 family)
MMVRCLLATMAIVLTSTLSCAQQAVPSGTRTLTPPGLFKVEGAWSLGVRAGDFVFLSGMPGIDPATNTMVADPEAQVRQALLNIRRIVESEGASLKDCVKLTVYLSDLNGFAAIVDKVETELWNGPPYPPRTLIEVQRLFDGMVVEIDSVFYTPVKK